ARRGVKEETVPPSSVARPVDSTAHRAGTSGERSPSRWGEWLRPTCAGSVRMGQRTVLVKLVGDDKDCERIVRFVVDLGIPRGGLLAQSPISTPGSALGSRPRVALSFAEVPRVYPSSAVRGKSPFCRSGGTESRLR